MPEELRTDVKPEDGWIVLDTTIKFVGDTVTAVADVDDGANYILLYNTHTGYLKGFYFAETMYGNNCGFWQLITSTDRSSAERVKTRLFNFAGETALAADAADSPQSVILASLTTNAQTQGFERGWNGFMLELAYDENSDKERLDVSGFAMTTAQISMTGAFDAKSTGTIFTSTNGKSGNITGVVKALGEGAVSWLQQNSGNKDKPIKVEVVNQNTRGIGSTLRIVAGTLFKVVNSFTGSKSSNTDFSFSTDGTMTIGGSMVTPTSGLIVPLTGLKLGRPDLKLGIWNASVQPTYVTDAYCEMTEYSSGWKFNYKLKQKGSVAIVKNPAYKGTLTSINAFVTYDKYKGSTAGINYPELHGSGPSASVIPSSTTPHDILYEDSETKISTLGSDYICHCNGERYWPDASTNTNPTRPAFSYASHGNGIQRNVFAKVLVTMTDSKDTHYSSKTFITKQSIYSINPGFHPAVWTDEALRKAGYWRN